MAGEPARALVTDQITSSSAIPDEDDSRRAMAVTAAVAAAIPAAIEGVLNGAVRRNKLSLVVKHRLQTELITALDKATKDACALSFLRSCFFFSKIVSPRASHSGDHFLTGRLSSFHLTLRKVGVKYECLVL